MWDPTPGLGTGTNFLLDVVVLRMGVAIVATFLNSCGNKSPSARDFATLELKGDYKGLGLAATEAVRWNSDSGPPRY